MRIQSYYIPVSSTEFSVTYLLKMLYLQVKARSLECEFHLSFALQAMFSYGLRESHERLVPIHGVSSDVMQRIIEFAYTGINNTLNFSYSGLNVDVIFERLGRCELQKQCAAEVMMAADLLQMLHLKEAAIEFLSSCIDVNNCLFVRY